MDFRSLPKYDRTAVALTVGRIRRAGMKMITPMIWKNPELLTYVVVDIDGQYWIADHASCAFIVQTILWRGVRIPSIDSIDEIILEQQQIPQPPLGSLAKLSVACRLRLRRLPELIRRLWRRFV